MEVKLGVASSPHVGEDVRRHYGEVYGEMLRELGVSLAESSDVAVVVVLTGGAEEEVLSQAASYNVLLAWPHYNSLPSALEAAAALREGGRYAKVLELPAPLASPGEPLLRALRLISLMKTGVPKFGVVGRPNRWLVASGLEAAAAEETPLEETLEGLNPGDGMEEARRIVDEAEGTDFSAADLAPIVAYARRLEELAKRRGWAGLTPGLLVLRPRGREEDGVDALHLVNASQPAGPAGGVRGATSGRSSPCTCFLGCPANRRGSATSTWRGATTWCSHTTGPRWP